MPLAALIIVGDYGVGERPPMLMRVAGQTLLERMIRQLAAVGANHIVLLVSAVPGDIVSVIDKLSREGLSVDLARGAADAADRIHPDETLLIIDGPLVIAQRWFELMRDQSGDTLITVPKAAGDRFERIDAHDHWLGLGRINGATLRMISSELGDWALGPTLLRKAIQLGAARIAYGVDVAHLPAARPETPDELAVLQSAALAHGVEHRPSGWFIRSFDRVGTRAIHMIARRNIAFQSVEHVALILFALSISASVFGQLGWATLAIVLGAVAGHAALFIRGIAIGGKSYMRSIGALSDVAFAALPVATALRSIGADAGAASLSVTIILSAWMTAQWLLVRQSRTNLPRALGWSNDNAGLALIFGIGWCFGLLVAAMGVITLMLLVEHGLRQHFSRRE